MVISQSKRWLALILAAFVVFSALSAMAWKLMNTAPAWARRHGSSNAQAQHADQRLLDAVNWTADAQRRRTMPAAAEARLLPLPPLSLTFSQDDLDAFFDQCNEQFGWIQDNGGSDNPAAGVVLEGDRLILAVAPADGGSVFSVQFEPKLVDGRLIVPVVRVQKGMLPVPAALWHAWRDGMIAQLRKQLPAAANRARIESDGSASNSLIQAQTLRLLIDALEDRPAEPIVFFPYIQDFRRHFLPVRLTRIDIVDHELQLTARPLDRDESEALVEGVQEESP
jgi:hypothetical protein